MKTKVPYWINEVHTEGGRLLIAFMWMIHKEHGFNTWYYMVHHDVNIILGITGPEFFDMAEVYPKFQIADSGWDQYRCSFDKEYREIEYEFTGHRERLVWAYLMGYVADFGTYIEETKRPGRHRVPKHKLKGEMVKQFRGK